MGRYLAFTLLLVACSSDGDDTTAADTDGAENCETATPPDPVVYEVACKGDETYETFLDIGIDVSTDPPTAPNFTAWAHYGDDYRQVYTDPSTIPVWDRVGDVSIHEDGLLTFRCTIGGDPHDPAFIQDRFVVQVW